MDTEQPTARYPRPTQQLPPQPAAEAAESAAGDPADPLAKITMRPRTFAAVLAAVALLLGLILAVMPVHVAGANPVEPGSVSCGNTIGGVETGALAEDLGRVDQQVLATYVNTCEGAISTRLAFSWPLFFAGALSFAWFGVVRRRD
jgi:hypothetical protein